MRYGQMDEVWHNSVHVDQLIGCRYRYNPGKHVAAYTGECIIALYCIHKDNMAWAVASN